VVVMTMLPDPHPHLLGSLRCVQTCQMHMSLTKDVTTNIRANKIAGRPEGKLGNCEGGEMWLLKRDVQGIDSRDSSPSLTSSLARSARRLSYNSKHRWRQEELTVFVANFRLN
jgi:hypothetical protein